MNTVTQTMKNQQKSDGPDDYFTNLFKDYLKRIPEGYEKDKLKMEMLNKVMEVANNM